MRIQYIEGAVDELNNLSLNPALDHYSPEVIASNFYQAVQTIRVLSTGGAGLGPQAFLLLAKIVSVSPTLRALDLRGAYFGFPEALDDIAEHLSHSKTLRVLKLSKLAMCYVTAKTAEHLARSESLCILDLSKNNLYENIEDIVKHLSHSKTIHTLDISGAPLGNLAGAAAKHLSHFKALHTLSIDCLSEYAEEAAKYLSYSKTLRTLNLSRDRVGEYALTYGHEADVEVAGIINNHNREVNEWHTALEVLNQIYGSAGSEYGVVSSIIEAVSKDSDEGGEIPQNVIELVPQNVIVHIRDIREAEGELNHLSSNPELDHRSPEVIATTFYQVMQTINVLDARPAALSPQAFLLLAKIACVSPTLRTLNLSGDRISEYALTHGPDAGVSVAGIINNHNREVNEWHAALEVLNQIYGSAGSEYGVVGSIIEAVGKDSWEDLPQNVIELHTKSS